MHTLRKVQPWKIRMRQLASRPALQGVWLALSKLAYAGMNYGGGQMVEDSGEREALCFALQAMPASEPLVLFDVGANQGDYLGAALRLLGTRVRAFSFEPQPFNIGVLEQRFGSDARVTLVEAALGSEAATAELHFDADGDPTASLHLQPGEHHTHHRPVRVTTVDQVCLDHGVARIDMLKIDAEGNEMEVLFGARSMLERGAVHAIQFEFGETFLQTPYHFRDFHDLLAPHYRMYRILRHGLVELPAYTPDLEVYKLANFLCVHRPAG